MLQLRCLVPIPITFYGVWMGWFTLYIMHKTVTSCIKICKCTAHTSLSKQGYAYINFFVAFRNTINIATTYSFFLLLESREQKHVMCFPHTTLYLGVLPRYIKSCQSTFDDLFFFFVLFFKCNFFYLSERMTPSMID